MSRATECLARLWWGPPLWEMAALEARPSDFSVSPDGSIDAEQAEWLSLVAAADLFLRAGGTVSPGWWLRLTPLERLALVDAGDRLSAARAVAFGAASTGGVADVASRIDGGAARLRCLLQREVSAVAAEVRGQEIK